MALAMRGDADRDALIKYADTADVPASWRNGPLKVTLGGDTAPPKASRSAGQLEKATPTP